MNNNKDLDKKIKWDVIYDENTHTTIWKYDLRITPNGPYCVEVKYKKNYSHIPEKKKTLGDYAKEFKKN
jgi:hypothetical protein